MALWGSADQANNSPIYAPAQFKVTPNTANRDALYGNTTANALFAGETIGVYGVSDVEATDANSVSVAHSGWVVVRTGQGGRTGRVQTEVLVAGGISGDSAANDDPLFPQP